MAVGVSGLPGVHVAPALTPASGRYEVGDVLILSCPGMKPREFRVTAVNETSAHSTSYTMVPVDVDGNVFWDAAPGWAALEAGRQ